jgi:glucokinase
MGQDTFLLADVGGTNTRLALGTRKGLLAQTIASYSNDNFNSFIEVLHNYQAKRPIHSASMAIAGQIIGANAQLTNRNWSFDSDNLADEIGCKQVHFINDMSGLARAIPVLSSCQSRALQSTPTLRPNNQSLVIGLGTGVNVSALLGNTTLIPRLP